MTKIYFRCDSSSDIGSGHVIRCLTLANFLKKKGLFTTFICKETEGNLFDVILKHNHNLVVLSNSNKKNIWELYFKQLSNYSLSEVYKSKSVYFSKLNIKFHYNEYKKKDLKKILYLI